MTKLKEIIDEEILIYFRDRLNKQEHFALYESERIKIRELSMFYGGDSVKIPDNEKIIAYKVDYHSPKDAKTDFYKTNLKIPLQIPINRIEYDTVIKL